MLQSCAARALLCILWKERNQRHLKNKLFLFFLQQCATYFMWCSNNSKFFCNYCQLMIICDWKALLLQLFGWGSVYPALSCYFMAWFYYIFLFLIVSYPRKKKSCFLWWDAKLRIRNISGDKVQFTTYCGWVCCSTAHELVFEWLGRVCLFIRVYLFSCSPTFLYFLLHSFHVLK